jgi:hypothetical protein
MNNGIKRSILALGFLASLASGCAVPEWSDASEFEVHLVCGSTRDEIRDLAIELGVEFRCDPEPDPLGCSVVSGSTAFLLWFEPGGSLDVVMRQHRKSWALDVSNDERVVYQRRVCDVEQP